MKYIKIFICSVVIGFVLVFSCCAQVYTSDFPTYCPNSGGAWAEVNTGQGRSTFVVGRDCIFDVFSYFGSSGYNVLNSTSNTIQGTIYFKNNTNFYGNPTSLTCRFSPAGTLEVYEPYFNVNRVAYRWTSLPTTEVYNTNIAFIDYAGERQNNDYIYSVPEKMQIIIILLIISLLLYFIFGRAWKA